jgi:hypothetical protein
MGDPRESSSYSVTPRIRYNTIGGVNGPLVILENVSDGSDPRRGRGDEIRGVWGYANERIGQIP